MTDQTFTKIRPHRQPDGRVVAHVELRDGYYVPSRFLAVSDAVSLDVEVGNDGVPRCRRLELVASPGEAITSESLRRVPVARLLRQATAGAARQFEPLEPGGEPVFQLVPSAPREVADFYRRYVTDTRRPRRGVPVSDDHLKQVAELYRAALDRGDPPTQTVADAMHAARSTAARWIAKARERGFLGAALPSQAGERREEGED